MFAIQPSLFCGASVIRNCGRIESSGHAMMETFKSRDDATTALSRLKRTKRSRSHRDVLCAETRLEYSKPYVSCGLPWPDNTSSIADPIAAISSSS
ncbi:WGR domain-containing protein [Rhizobium rhizophilum]|nr:WGR domain-containing protein [Rhizobium rhizophilum]